MNEFKVAVLKLAVYYCKQLSDEQVVMYSDQLSKHLTIDELRRSMAIYVNDPRNILFPIPVSKLTALIKAPVAAEDIAVNVSSLLLQCERKFCVHWEEGVFFDGRTGYPGKEGLYLTWADAVKSMVGDIGLKIIQRFGGWVEFCQTIYSSPDGVPRAQIRNMALSLHNTAKSTGTFDYVGTPQVSGGEKSNVLDFVKIKQIEGGSNVAKK